LALSMVLYRIMWMCSLWVNQSQIRSYLSKRTRKSLSGLCGLSGEERIRVCTTKTTKTIKGWGSGIFPLDATLQICLLKRDQIREL